MGLLLEGWLKNELSTIFVCSFDGIGRRGGFKNHFDCWFKSNKEYFSYTNLSKKKII